MFRIGVIAVIAIGALVFRDRLSSSAADLKIGDCFDVPATNIDIKDVQHHPCTESHTGEVFVLASHPAAKGTAPLTEPQLIDYLTTTCAPVFASYVGQVAATNGVLDFGAFYPLDKDWNDGDRGVTCYAYRIDEKPMTTSLKKVP
ncbi:MAG: septum formation family protein [Candidatus Limnocylindrales bacterium]